MQYSRAVTRKSASNLALAFVLLPKPKRDAMSALYAFCREVDDVADETAEPVQTRRARLEEWRADIARACAGKEPCFPINRELQPFIRQYRLPLSLFEEIINGVEMDLEITRYPSYKELDRYCFRVASAVGLLSIEIFGYRNVRCREYAEALGKALQLTNILRDVQTDAERGRIYLPQSELTRFNVSEEEVLAHRYSDRFKALAASVADRARSFYRAAREVLPPEDRQSMVAAELMGAVYWRLLERLAEQDFRVFGSKPIKVGKLHKLLLIAKAWWRFSSRRGEPAYGRP